jgi:hypothetical protein
MENNPDKRRELWLEGHDNMTRHCLGIAATGGGKTNFLTLILKQQMMRGGGAIHIDGKNSKEAIIDFLNLARQHNRWHDVRIINIDDASLSNTYNPLLRGDADELTARIMDLIPEKGGDSYFRSQAVSGLRAMAGVVRDMNMPLHFGDMLIFMQNKSALRWLLQNGPKDSREYQQFKGWYEGMQEIDRRTGAMVLNEKKHQHAFGDLIGRLNPFGTGHTGRVLNNYNPEVDLYQAIHENALIYVALPMLSKQTISSDFAKLFMSDLKTAIGKIQNDDMKPAPTFLTLMDEFSSYAMPSLAPVFEQARSANVCLFPFIQTFSSLKDREKGLGEDFANKIIGNTWNKICFKLNDHESREEMSKLVGQHKAANYSESHGQKVGFASGQDDASILRTGTRGLDYSKSVTYDYEEIVRPEEFGALDVKRGEAIFIGGENVYKLRVPLVQVPKLSYISQSDALDFPRFRMPFKKGLNLADMYKKVSKSDDDSTAA